MGLLKQEAEHGALNVPHLSKYILNMMTLLCAPVRDEAVQKLENITDPVRLLRCEASPRGRAQQGGTLAHRCGLGWLFPTEALTDASSPWFMSFSFLKMALG